MASILTTEGRQEALADPIFREKIKILRLKAAQDIWGEIPVVAVGSVFNRYILAKAVINRHDQFAQFDINHLLAVWQDVEYTALTDEEISACISASWNIIADTI